MEKEIFHPKVRKFLLCIEELLKMDLSLTLIKIEKIHSSLLSVKEWSLRDGIKDLPVCVEVNKPHWYVLLNMHMVLGVLHQESHPTQPSISKLNSLTSKIRKKRSGKWAQSKKLKKQPKLNKKGMIFLKMGILQVQLPNILQASNMCQMMMMNQPKQFWKH